MTPDEAALMQAHTAYWHEGIANRTVVVFGFVADSSGAYGVGIVEFDDEGGPQAFTDADPVMRANRGFEYRIAPMPFGVATRS